MIFRFANHCSAAALSSTCSPRKQGGETLAERSRRWFANPALETFPKREAGLPLPKRPNDAVESWVARATSPPDLWRDIASKGPDVREAKFGGRLPPRTVRLAVPPISTASFGKGEDWAEGKGDAKPSAITRFASDGVRNNFRRAFTLIELILVLALLAIVTSFSAPSLSRFFRGRTLESEARRLLSLTHAAQSRAVSDGFPVLLWIDTPQHQYGLQLETSSQTSGSQDVDPKAEQFIFDDNLKVEALNASIVTLNGRSVNTIRFLPDGTADEASPTTLRIASRNGDVLWLMQATNRLSYEIRNSDK